MDADDFGFTNDQAQFDAAVAWRVAAIADGWAAEASYDGEPMESACRLTRDGFVAHVLARTNKPGGRWKFTAKVDAWGPDRMAVRSPMVYDWGKLLQGTQHCKYCGADGVDTQRVGFAGRCCAACIVRERARIERPGWDD